MHAECTVWGPVADALRVCTPMCHTRYVPHLCPQTPSSDFWKELRLALPRKVHYRAMEGDPQTRLQDDKDPMLIVGGHIREGRTLDPELDPDPEGDLGMCTQPHP